MEILEWLERIDKVLFVFIHNDADHKFLDQIIPLFRNAGTWIPLYLFMLFYFVKTAKERAWQIILLTVLTFAATDIMSAALCKPLFARLRPCYDPELKGLVRDLVSCGGLYSLPSSHAANHFGLAFFWYKSIHIISGKKWHWLWIWATVVGYAQVYVGKHFPMDIVAGALLGCAVASLMTGIFKRLWNSPNNNQLRSINVFMEHIFRPRNSGKSNA